MPSPGQERYEAITRAVLRPAWIGFFVSIGVALVIVFVGGVVYRLFQSDLPPEWPQWLRFAAFAVPFGIALIVVPNLAQLLVIRGDRARAIEAVNALWLGEQAAYTAATGRKPPAIGSLWGGNLKAARRWLSRGEGYGTRLRLRTLIWTGELDAAAEVLAAMPATDATGAFYRSLLLEELQFVATGTMDLAEPHAALARVAPSDERDLASLNLAFAEARLDLDEGRDPFARLAAARLELGALPRGASIRDRLFASMPMTAGLVAVVAVILWVIS